MLIEWGNVSIAFGHIIHASLLWPEKQREVYAQLGGNEKVVGDEVFSGFFFLGQHGLAAFTCEEPKRLGNG